MLQFRLTAKLQKEIGLKASDLSEIADSDTLLGNWYVNIFTLNRRKTLIFVNEKTLYSFILYGVKKSNISSIGKIFIKCLEQALAFEGIQALEVEKIKNEYCEFQFTKTADKKVLGNMVDLVNLYTHFVYHDGGILNCDLTEIIFRINRTPQRNIEWGNSINALRNLLGLEKLKPPSLL